MVLFQVTPGTFEFELFFILTLILIATKVVLLIYVGSKLIARKREGGSIGTEFIFGIFILLLSLLISRLFFIYFDFILTEFDSTQYYLFPNYIFWKIGMVTTSVGIGILLFITDKKVLNFKLKGIFTYIAFAGGIIILVYPVSSSDDFAFISGLSIISNGGIVILLFFFIYIAIKTPGSVRRNALFIVIGGLLYAVGVLLVNEAILTQLRNTFGEQIHILIFFLFILFKVIGLILMSYAFTKFAI